MAKSSSGQSVSDIDQYIRNADFPADRNELQRIARQNDAPQEVQDRLKNLPERRFNSASEVNSQLQGGQGGKSGTHREGNVGREGGSSEGTMGAGYGGSGGKTGQGPTAGQGSQRKDR